MATLNQLKQEVVANPADMAPRLVMADWLEERGDVRGEFIRIQCRLAELAEFAEESREYDELDRKQLKIIKKHRDDWVSHLKPYCKQARLYRGFAEDIVFGVRQFLKHAEEVYDLAPVRLTRIMQVSEKTYDEVLAHPAVKHWNELGICGGFTEDHWKKFANHKDLNSLTKICFTQNRIDHPFVKIFLDGSVAKQLVDLEFGIFAIGAEGVMCLARCKNLAKLKKLDLGNVPSSESAMSALVNNEHLSKLETLWMRTMIQYANQPDELVWSEHAIPSIVNLNLERNPMPEQFIVELFQRFHWPNLKRINLTSCGLTASVVQQIAESDRIAQMTTLDISDNVIRDQAMVRLLSSGKLGNLRVLRIRKCRISDVTAKCILESEALNQLNRLDMSGNVISSDLQKALRKKYGTGVCKFSRNK